MELKIQNSLALPSLILRLFNILIFPTSLYLVTQGYFIFSKTLIWSENYFLLAILAGFFFDLGGKSNPLNQANHFRYKLRWFKKICFNWLIVFLVILTLTFFLKTTQNYSRISLGIWFLIIPFNIFITHQILFKIFYFIGIKNTNKIKVVILGAGELGKRFLEVIHENSWIGFEVIGFYDDYKKKTIRGLPILGKLNQAAIDAKKSQWQRAFIALPLRHEKKIHKTVDQISQDSSVLIDLIPDLFPYESINSQWKLIGDIPIISLRDSPIRGINTVTKRCSDIILSTLILFFISPLMLIIALLVAITSPGGIFFIQERYGINGKIIKVYKFRSMYFSRNRVAGQDVKKNDQTVTPLGKFLRKTSLDELPQFINVLQGKMSVVGPRPHAKAFNDQYRKQAPLYMKRHFIKPGITGWAQVNGYRGETNTKEKILGRTKYDLYYLSNWSLYFDFKIILLTIINGFINKNAY